MFCHTSWRISVGEYFQNFSKKKKDVFIFSPDSFLLVSPTSQSTRNMKWLKSHVPEDGSVFLSDVTSLYTALNVIGPKAKYLLAELSDENFNDFARMTCQVNHRIE